MKKLKVPYVSQWDQDANFSRDDCIATCCSMLLSYYGKTLTTNQIAEKIGAQGLINFTQIHDALKSFGYRITGYTSKNLADLEMTINDETPFLAIVHYGDLPGRQDSYTGGHSVVVVGYDSDFIYVNDPDFWGSRRDEGISKPYPTENFLKAWKSLADGNGPGNFWYFGDLTPPSQTESVEALNREIANLKIRLADCQAQVKDLQKKDLVEDTNLRNIIKDIEDVIES